MRGRGAIFLDRDGTLNRKAPEGQYIRTPAELVLLPGAALAVERINRAGVPVILITNQRWLSEPRANAGAYAAIERELTCLLAAEGAALDASYVCPHAKGVCECRKPAPGMLFQAARELGICLSESFMIGDAVTDVQAGLAAGARAILLGHDELRANSPEDTPYDRAPDVAYAIDWAITRLTGTSVCYESVVS
jgi:D-glycero-D-manno-heptose 1,7-bisphosphate phosphatase